VNLHWALHNARRNLAWPDSLQVIPVMCAPSARMFFESKVCPLEPLSTSNLQIKLRIPRESNQHYFAMLFKLKAPNSYYTGPNMIAFIKIVNTDLIIEDEDRSNSD
jgi:hypothetical protein